MGSTRTHQARHAAVRAPGPVTAAFGAIQAPWSSRWIVRAWPAFPPLALLVPLVHRISPAPWVDDIFGFDAVLCLIACLAVTPFITVARAKIAKLRWWYGIWMFVLGVAAVAIHMTVPPDTGMAGRMAGSAVSWTGVMIVVLLFPMAATSSAVAQKALGPEWKRWQRSLIWFVWALVAVHMLLLRQPLYTGGFILSSVPLIALRQRRLRQAIKKWRAAGYSTGGLWFIMAVSGTVLAAGLVILIAGEALAVAHAIAIVPGP